MVKKQKNKRGKFTEKSIKKSNLLYVFYATFNSDLLFWIVVDSLFLTTVKGMSEFNVLLITMLGMLFSILLYPLNNLVIKKISNKWSNIIGSVCYLLAIILFTVCNHLIGFIIAQTIYGCASPFKQAATIILKNNLQAQGKEDEFVKWKSYGRLGYSIITAIIAACSGVLFNVWAYLPMILSICGAVISLILSIIYSEDKSEDEKPEEVGCIKKLLKNKLMVIIFLSNLILVSTYVFLQTKASLLIQNICFKQNFEVAKVSIIVSVIILISRLFRVGANFFSPFIYKKMKNKANILKVVSYCLLIAGILFALGGNLNINVYFNLILISLGLFIVVSVRDLYGTIENKIIINNFEKQEQKQALVLANVYGNIGRLFINFFALVVLKFASLNLVYIFMLIFALSQIFIAHALAKYLKA